MKKIIFIMFLIPVITFSQDNDTVNQNDFLTDLFLGNKQIKNQDFQLKLSGVINQKAQMLKDGYYSNDKKYLTEVLFLDDLRVAQQIKSNVFIGDKGKVIVDDYGYQRGFEPFDDFEDKCSWNWTGKNPNLKMIHPSKLLHGYLPTFSFLKGKLLTIIDSDSSENDYLFSVSISEDHNDYGHKVLSFNLSDDNEKGYTIRTIIINEQCYIIFNTSEMQALGLEIPERLTKKTMFEIKCQRDEEFRYARAGYYKDCYCECKSDYFSIWREKTKYMNKDFSLAEKDLLYIFKLELKN